MKHDSIHPIPFAILFFCLLLAGGAALPPEQTGCWAGSANIPFVVYIDVGHGKARPGATSARGATEYSFNERIGKALFEELSQYPNIRAVLPAAREDSSLSQRVQAAEASGACLFLSIHHDSVQPAYLRQWTHEGRNLSYCDRFHGFSIFVSRKNGYFAPSLQFADLLGDALTIRGLTPSLHHAEKIGGENRTLLDPKRGIYQFDNLVVLKDATSPALLLECGVIVNRDEELLLMTPEYRKKIVSALSGAIRSYSASAGCPPSRRGAPGAGALDSPAKTSDSGEKTW